MPRPTSSGILGAFATCTKCGWKTEGKNAVGLGAQHYDRCGGQVQVEVTRVVIFG